MSPRLFAVDRPVLARDRLSVSLTDGSGFCKNDRSASATDLWRRNYPRTFVRGAPCVSRQRMTPSPPTSTRSTGFLDLLVYGNEDSITTFLSRPKWKIKVFKGYWTNIAPFGK